jgi:hypothetical protein
VLAASLVHWTPQESSDFAHAQSIWAQLLDTVPRRCASSCTPSSLLRLLLPYAHLKRFDFGI